MRLIQCYKSELHQLKIVTFKNITVQGYLMKRSFFSDLVTREDFTE